MIKFERTRVMNFEEALRGMRNPLESWDKSDSIYFDLHADGYYIGESTKVSDRPLKELGELDKKLALNLARAGSDHGKFLRQIHVTVNITAPLYWWKEFDTYKVGTVANSTSTMHKLGSRPLVLGDFSLDDEDGEQNDSTWMQYTLEYLNNLIVDWKKYTELAKNSGNKTEVGRYLKMAKNVWRHMIQDLPSSFNQTRTVTMNYQVLRTIFHSDRKNHKQHEWKDGFIDWIKTLPASELITAPPFNKEADKLKEKYKDVLERIQGELYADSYVKPSTYANIVKIIDEALKE